MSVIFSNNIERWDDFNTKYIKFYLHDKRTFKGIWCFFIKKHISNVFVFLVYSEYYANVNFDHLMRISPDLTYYYDNEFKRLFSDWLFNTKERMIQVWMEGDLIFTVVRGDGGDLFFNFSIDECGEYYMCEKDVSMLKYFCKND